MPHSARTLDQWLSHIETLHPLGIDLGLDRIGNVAGRLGFAAPFHRPAPRSVIVAGTNGKGSTCVALEALLRAAGLEVGTTLSPHLHAFNERVRLGGVAADDATLCAAFARVEAARADTPLTYFEFAALVALDCFRQAEVDVAVLEVGLGGRLDAFNLVAADLAVITSIGLDHREFLGDDLEVIGREKAGVMRRGQRVVLGAEVTASVVETARTLGCPQTRLGDDFNVRLQRDTWDFIHPRRPLQGLPLGGFAPANCALALEAAGHLLGLDTGWAAPLPAARVGAALAAVALPGRMETWSLGEGADARLLVLDVAHNPAGAAFLAEQLRQRCPGRRFVAIAGTLADKDGVGVARALREPIRHWICVPTRGPRGLAGAALAERLRAGAAVECGPAQDVADGLRQAFAACQPGDAILTLGSFDIVEQMRELLLARPLTREVGWGAVANTDLGMGQHR